MTLDDELTHRSAVRARYSDLAAGCCDESTGSTGCCDSPDPESATNELGYSAEELAAVDSGANLGLGCGNPVAIANLEPGETVLDLGSGGGFDCFLAAREVGEDGSVIGVDMTPEMVEKARANAKKNDVANAEFRLGEIEHLPVPDQSVDVILSNCVINLSPEKHRVFEEAVRVLRPGGRLSITDVVRTAPFPPHLEVDVTDITACVGGAASIDELESMMTAAGLEEIHIEPKEESAQFIREWDDDRDLSDHIVSARIEATKPR